MKCTAHRRIKRTSAQNKNNHIKDTGKREQVATAMTNITNHRVNQIIKEVMEIITAGKIGSMTLKEEKENKNGGNSKTTNNTSIPTQFMT